MIYRFLITVDAPDAWHETAHGPGELQGVRWCEWSITKFLEVGLRVDAPGSMAGVRSGDGTGFRYAPAGSTFTVAALPVESPVWPFPYLCPSCASYAPWLKKRVGDVDCADPFHDRYSLSTISFEKVEPTAVCAACGAMVTGKQAWSHGEGRCVPKSARRWLKWDDVIPKAAPLQLVVWSVELAFSFLGVWKLLSLLGV